jgi:hypothetical protein
MIRIHHIHDPIHLLLGLNTPHYLLISVLQLLSRQLPIRIGIQGLENLQQILFFFFGSHKRHQVHPGRLL